MTSVNTGIADCSRKFLVLLQELQETDEAQEHSLHFNLTCFLSGSKNAAQQEKGDWMPAQKHASPSAPSQCPV